MELGVQDQGGDLERLDGVPLDGESTSGPNARQEIAARVRALFDERPIADLAGRLHLSIDQLSEAVDVSIPAHPVEVLAAISYAYGVDPTWLVTGEYDPRTHAASAASVDDAAKVIRSVLGNSPRHRWRDLDLP